MIDEKPRANEKSQIASGSANNLNLKTKRSKRGNSKSKYHLLDFSLDIFDDELVSRAVTS